MKNTEQNTTEENTTQQAEPVLKPKALPPVLTRRLTCNGNVIESYDGDPAQMTWKIISGNVNMVPSRIGGAK